MSKTPGIGQDADAFCSKCKMLLNHVVTAKLGDRIKKVKCLTCQTEHAYKEEGKAASKKSPSGFSRATSGSRTALRASDYDRLMQGRSLEKATPYERCLAYQKNDLLSHPQFGVGLVLLEKDGRKIEVAFPSGVKVLLHNQDAS